MTVDCMRRAAWRLGLLLAILLCVSCAKETGGGDDETGDDAGDDDTGAVGVAGEVVYLNMVPVVLGDAATAKSLNVYDSAGAARETEAIVVADVLAGIPAFAPDAAKFAYAFETGPDALVPEDEGGRPLLADLAKAAFYEGDADQGLCVGWTETGHEAASACAMDGGALVTFPLADAFPERSIGWVDERTGDAPAHLGEEAAITGVVTVPTSTIVFGSYLKMFLQEGDYGVKVFGDWSATVADQGYDGSLLAEVETFEGDEVFALGTVTEHDGMIEFVPRSAYHIAVLARNRPAPEAALRTIEELAADPTRYAGALVRVDDASLADVDPDDPATGWPAYGTKSKDIRIRQATGPKIGLPIYEGTGIPGSFEPDPGFDVVGALSIEGTGLAIYPRKIEDVNPTDATLAGTVRVSVVGEDRHADVDLATLPASLQRIEAGGEPVPVVSLASVTVASGLLRHPNRLKYKPVAYDGRKPFETLPLVGLKSGVLYQGAPASEEEPDPLVSSYFWEGMDLSEIYFLRGVTDVLAFRAVAAPPEGDAEHGKGITLMIGGRKFAVNFDTLPHTTVDGQDAIAVGAFLVGEVIDLFTMDGSFTPDQIKRLHDYRLVSFDGETERTVRLDDLAGGYVLLTDPPTAVFPDLGADARVEDVYVLDMMRYIQVDDGIGEPTVVYLRDCATEAVEVEPDVTEEVVFYRTVLEAAGIDTSRDMYLFDFWLLASDNFTSIFPYTHDHLSAMYFRPDANRGYTTDPDLADYGGRVSTKAVYEIELHDVPQAAPSLPVVIDEETRWGTDANACEGCHYKNDAVQIPVDCAACHVVP